MSNYTNIPLLSPFKFYKTDTATVHFDGNYFENNIKPFERKICYFQKWQIADTTLLQITSTIAPSPLNIYKNGVSVKTIAFANVGTVALGVMVFEALVDFATIADGIYYLGVSGALMSNSFAYLSEPIHLKATHANTMLFTVYNSYNDFDVVFTTNYKLSFRCEAGIMDFNPERERASFTDEVHDIKTLSATPYRQYKLFIGDAVGVAPWVIDTLNRIFCCNHVEIDGLQYETTEGAKWEVARQKGYPAYGASIDITEALNLYSNQSASGLITPGVVTAYDLDTNFFGASPSIVHVTEIQILNP